MDAGEHDHEVIVVVERLCGDGQKARRLATLNVPQHEAPGGDVIGERVAQSGDDLVCHVIGLGDDIIRQPESAPCVDPARRVVVSPRDVPLVWVLGDEPSVVPERFTDPFTELGDDLFGSLTSSFSQRRLRRLQPISLHSVPVCLKRILKVLCVHLFYALPSSLK